MTESDPSGSRLGIFAVAGGFVLCLWVACAGLLWQNRSEALVQAGAQEERFISGAETALNRSLLGIDVLLASTGELLFLSKTQADGLNTHTVDDLLRVSAQQNLLVRLTLLVDEKGQLLASSSPGGVDHAADFPAGFLADVLSPKVSALTISVPAQCSTSAEAVLFLGRMMTLADGSRAAAVAKLPIALLNEILTQGAEIEGLQVTLERGNGTLLTSTPSATGIAPAAQPLSALGQQGGPAVRSAARLSGEDALVVVRPTMYNDVMVTASIPVAAALHNWRIQRDFVVSATLVFSIMVLAATGFALWYLGQMNQSRLSLAQSKAKIERLAFFDPLTDLPNRRLLTERLEQALATGERTKQYGVLLFLDLDHFKNLNDTLGHDIGDLLLQDVARRLTACVREEDTVARLGGDEFVVMLEDLAVQPHNAVALARRIGEKILAKLNERYQLGPHVHYSTPSIGATLLGGAHMKAEDLIKQADIAMYQAKAQGRNSLCFFDPQMQADISARAQLESDLRLALSADQFELHYQPQITLAGEVVGAEVLIRWRHPQRGMVSPAEFIPVAEQTELILPIGEWVLRTACEQLVRWQSLPARSALQLSVNVSARQFRQPDFVAEVAEVLTETGIQPDRLKLELTESLVLDNVDDTILKMSQLKALGVRFSVDDFGTGQSSLSYLTRLPLDQLKIDQSFVRNIGIKPTDGVIVQTIIGMARNLGLEVIAEGVETQAQQDFLAQHGCTVYQGYLLGRPTPLAAFEALLATA